MWSDTPTLCGRTLRPYVVGHPDLIGLDTPSLRGRTLRNYAYAHCVIMLSGCAIVPTRKSGKHYAYAHRVIILSGFAIVPTWKSGKDCTSLYNSCFGFCLHKTPLPTAVFRRPWRNLQTQLPAALFSRYRVQTLTNLYVHGTL